MLRHIYELCDKETGYDRGGMRREPWCKQTAPMVQLRDTMENISAASRARRQEYVSVSEIGGYE